MDIPAANCVIRFDPMHHAVSFCQGRGRARQENCSFVVLAQRVDRSVEFPAEMEREQLRLVGVEARVLADLPVCGKEAAAAAARRAAAEREAQLDRERTATQALKSAAVKPNATALGMLMEYCKKTKIDLGTKDRQQTSGHGWTVDLVYESVLRRVETTGAADKKAKAKSMAAADLLKALQVA